VNTPAREWGPAFSPDGRWLAYHSTESGRDEVYVRPFPGPDPPVVISNAGGETPSWSRTRDELVYTTPGVDYDRVLMAAPYRVRNGVFLAEKPRPWASRAVRLRHILQQHTYALHPDGQRVAIAQPSEGEAIRPDHLTFVMNFFDALRRIAPAGR
jgi:serine/threonine-protein kinase